MPAVIHPVTLSLGHRTRVRVADSLAEGGQRAHPAGGRDHRHSSPLGALHNDVVEYDEQIQEMVDDDEDLAEYVRRLEEMGEESFGGANQLEFEFEEDADDDDSGSILVDEVEQFLRDQEGN